MKQLNQHRRLLLKSACISTLSALGACGGDGGGDEGDNATTTTPYALGWTEAPSETYAAISRLDATSFNAFSASYFASDTASLDLSNTSELALAGWPSILPTPGNQGTQGSCVAWGVAYATATSSNAVAGRGDASSAARIGSPADLYAKLIKRETWNSCGNGTIIKDALDIMVEEGVLPHSQVPYSDQGCTTPSNSGALFLDGYAKIAVTDREAIKRALQGFHILPFGMRVYSDFFNVGQSVYSGPLSGSTDSGGHCMTIIGYDNSAGCYKVQNSWGTNWGSSGFVRISYSSFERLATEVYAPFNYSSQLANHLYDQKDASGAGRVRGTQANITSSRSSPAGPYSFTLSFSLNEWLSFTSYNIVLWTPNGSGGYQSNIVADNRSVQSLRGGAFTVSNLSESLIGKAQIASLNIGSRDRTGVITQISLFLRMNQGR